MAAKEKKTTKKDVAKKVTKKETHPKNDVLDEDEDIESLCAFG